MQDDIVFNVAERRPDANFFSVFGGIVQLPFQDQRISHTEHGVIVQIFVAIDKQFCRQCLISCCFDEHMREGT